MRSAKLRRGPRNSPRSRSGNRFRPSGFPRKSADLEVLTSDAGIVVFQPKKDRVHYLNQTAFLVLEFANGKNSPEVIAARLREIYGLAKEPGREVTAILEEMNRLKLIEMPRSAKGSVERNLRRQAR